jgi:hypothetical protein
MGDLSMSEKIVDGLMKCIGSTEPSTFNEFCRALQERDLLPPKSDQEEWKTVWARIHSKLEHLERQGLIDVDRVGGKIDSLQLTEAGADMIREEMDKERGLFQKL